MNWINYDRLVDHLELLLTTAPDRFDYRNGWKLRDDRGGCVDCHCAFLMGDGEDVERGGGSSIKAFLGVTEDESLAMWKPNAWESMFDNGSMTPMAGADGIREALRRLGILATRYERPAESTATVPALTADPMPASLRRTLNELLREVADPPAPVAATTGER